MTGSHPGTSTCHMLLSASPVLVPGVWGPFWSAVLPGSWLMEGGQSSTGGLLDHVITSHPAHPELRARARQLGVSVYQALEEELVSLATARDVPVSRLSRELHMWPDYHGNRSGVNILHLNGMIMIQRRSSCNKNKQVLSAIHSPCRSPLADPSLTGALVGLTLDTGLTGLATLYLATVQAICYGTRHIVDTVVAAGHSVTSLTVCGGLTNSNLFLQTQVKKSVI